MSQQVGEGRPVGKPDFPCDVIVMGGAEDKVVDVEGLQETADYYGVTPVVLPDTAHDLMLDTRWEVAAQRLDQWLQTLA